MARKAQRMGPDLMAVFDEAAALAQQPWEEVAITAQASKPESEDLGGVVGEP